MFLENQPGIYGRWKVISLLMSDRFTFVFMFPFLLDIWLNSVLTIRAFFKDPSSLLLDFLLSLMFIAFFIIGIVN
jgi:hypothetical protein